MPHSEPDTLFVLGLNRGLSVAPSADFPVVFGRHEPDVHIWVGAGDPYVSRRHGVITREYSRWVLHNTGQLPIRLPGSGLALSGDRVELKSGYTPLFIVAPTREHLFEVRIAAPHLNNQNTAEDAATLDPPIRELNPTEKLVLVCLAQRYLRHDPQPQPLTWAQVADELSQLRPTEKWTWRKAAHIVKAIRERLSAKIDGVLEEDVPQPVGNALNHNLITDLLITTTLVKSDLSLLDIRR
jgi:hypothetical protein